MDKLLSSINSPADLRRLSPKQLTQLAKEVRDLIIRVVSKKGGHLASNLGVVELTIALHYVFDFSRDKVIWDVGHQTYTHKIITGRRDDFHTLRRYGGISGFPRREESEYDHFNTGHSSTSISAALGMAVARDHNHDDYNVVAVIGDGALTAGLAFEGLNQAGYLKRKLMVILNDNEMSISPPVGAISGYLSQIIQGQAYNRLKRDVETILTAIPGIGSQMIRFARTLEESIRRVFVPGMLFEELGFRYIGPVRGHNIAALIRTFEQAEQMEYPCLIHVVTRKGKGYRPAEANPTLFHGSPPFDIDNGEFIEKEGSPPSYTSVFADTMIELARKDEKIVCITAAMPEGTGLSAFAKEFPSRLFDVGIAEQHGITFCAGLATQGLKPVAAIYSTFLQRAYDQLLHDVCLMDLPISIALDRAGVVGADGPTHHGLYDLSYLRSMPHIIIMAPKDENELRHMLKTAIETPHPVAVRYPRAKGLGVKLDRNLKTLPIGKAEVLREGEDVAILAIGRMVHPSVQAAERLSEDGIEATVVNARFVKPLDEELIVRLASSIPRLVTVEENSLKGGFGSAVLELLEEKGLNRVMVHRIGIPDEIVPHGDTTLLLSKYGLDENSIYLQIKKLLAEQLKVKKVAN
ncbi:MAG: 1-deoxy-D-xylulose-5-phosphate synthase [Candidatus Aminicenantes bacterium]|nr:1-deoxy-D-xylulose-5-phosphate synthase [Candidatus Aminicenantes bacterium]MDH5715231.1 1-deoxy-D-xylulose-5-phosphate synthase [Candidatus Aminicenantes bacterium]